MILYKKYYNGELGKEENPYYSYKCFKTGLTWKKYEPFILHILFLNIFSLLGVICKETFVEKKHFAAISDHTPFFSSLTNRSTDIILKPVEFFFS